MSETTPERYPGDRPRTATIRSRVMLEVASELVGAGSWVPKQALVRLRAQGSSDWPLTLFGSDAAGVIEDVAQGRVAVAIVNPATAASVALRGEAPFSRPIPLRAIATIPSFDQLGVVVHPRTGIENLRQLATCRGLLRISLRGGRPDHSVHMVVDHLLATVGTSIGALAEAGHVVGYDQGLPHHAARAALLRTGEVDLLCDEGIYNWADLASESGYRFLPVPAEALDRLEAMGYRRATIERARHRGLETDIATVDFSGFLIYTHADVDDEIVEAFCRALHARRDRIPWQGGPTLPLERMVVDAVDAPVPIPFHAAARRVWHETGVLPTP